jgi:broad specificity phosphatase PhoE
MRSADPLPWGQQTLDAITALAGSAPAAVLMRHPEREPIVDMKSADLIPLTPAGEAAARALGRRLPCGRRVRLWHSPVGRCAVTAQRLAEGFRTAGGEAELEGVLPILGGPYVLDVDGMLRLVSALGPRYARAWFDGEVPSTVMAPRDEVARQILRTAGDLLREAAPDSLLLFVTHDWNVMLVRESILGLTHEQVGWLDYMDGVLLTRDGAGIGVDWHGRRARVPGAELAVEPASE